MTRGNITTSVVDRMVNEADRWFMRPTYDHLDVYQNFKDQDDFLKKREYWNSLILKMKRMMMLIANIQTSSQKFYSWHLQTSPCRQCTVCCPAC